MQGEHKRGHRKIDAYLAEHGGITSDINIPKGKETKTMNKLCVLVAALLPQSVD
jgi:hypothetical protein